MFIYFRIYANGSLMSVLIIYNIYGFSINRKRTWTYQYIRKIVELLCKTNSRIKINPNADQQAVRS